MIYARLTIFWVQNIKFCLRYVKPHKAHIQPFWSPAPRALGFTSPKPKTGSQDWGVCKDFGLFDEDFCVELVDEVRGLGYRL